MVNVAVAGALGRMGRRIMELVLENPQAALAGALEYPGHPQTGQPVALAAGLPQAPGVVVDSCAQALAEARVLVDFTAPEATIAHVECCAELGKAAVVGTTGLNDAQRARLAELGQKIPLVFAANMSVGMNLMFRLVGLMARVLGDGYALELLEAHHDQKKDSPSGTAVKLLEELLAARGWDRDKLVHGRHGLVGARPQEEIGVSVIRGGDVVGEHTVFYLGQGERLELTHRASNRDVFARGAMRAALWVADQEPGLYDMQDVLGLKGDLA